MTPEIVSQLLSRMHFHSRSLSELHRAAMAAGSAWSEDQVALLLACMPEVQEEDGLYTRLEREQEDPLPRALRDICTSAPVPAAVLVGRLPRGVISTPNALCDIARKHPELELVGSNRIRRR